MGSGRGVETMPFLRATYGLLCTMLRSWKGRMKEEAGGWGLGVGATEIRLSGGKSQARRLCQLENPLQQASPNVRTRLF